MIEADKERFGKKMIEMANAFGRIADPEIMASYFYHLKRFPIEIVEQAIDQAIRRKTEGDAFEIRQLPTVPEITREAGLAISGSSAARKVGCAECDWTGWIASEDKQGYLTARRCHCLKEAIAAADEKDAERKKPKKKEPAPSSEPEGDEDIPF